MEKWTIVVLFIGIYAASSYGQSCGRDVDIAIVMDSSASVWSVDYKKQLNFVKTFVGKFDVDGGKARFAAVSFGDRVYTETAFPFSSGQTTAGLNTAIDNIRYQAGKSTQTGAALKYLRGTLMKKSRPGLPKIGIVLTDGKSTYEKETKKEAEKTKAAGITLFAIGVGDKTSHEELKAIASGRDFVYDVASYDALLGDFIRRFATAACPEPTTPDPRDQPCGLRDPSDINFVFDSWSARSTGGYNSVVRLIQEAADSEDFRTDGIRVGAITGKCGSVDGFALNAYSTKAEIGEHFDSASYSDYSTLLRKLTTTAYSNSNGGRSSARKIAILVLTGKIRNADEIITLAQRAKNSGVEIYVVTVGKTDIEVANAVSTTANWKHVYSYESYAELRNVGSELSRVICTYRGYRVFDWIHLETAYFN